LTKFLQGKQDTLTLSGAVEPVLNIAGEISV